MPAAVKAFHLPALNTKSILLATGLIAIITVVFFLPEIFGEVQRTLSGEEAPAKSIAVPNLSSEALQPIVQTEPAPQKVAIGEGEKSPLDEILYRLDSGYYFEEKVEESSEVVEPKDRLPEWNEFYKSPIGKTLSESAEHLLAFSKEVPDDASFTRAAISQLILLLQGYGSESVELLLAPQEYLIKLELSHAAVVDGLQKDNVSNDIQEKWLALGAEYLPERLAYHVDTDLLKGTARAEEAPTALSLSFVSFGANEPLEVEGEVSDTVWRVVLNSPGRRERTLELENSTQQSGQRVFRFQSRKAEGRFTLRAYNEHGGYIEKQYLFKQPHSDNQELANQRVSEAGRQTDERFLYRETDRV